MEILVIGAGACGLMAARLLAERGHAVTVVEARDRTGGRIHTIYNRFSCPVEEGAEFVHGEQPLTASIMREAEIKRIMLSGSRYQLWKGRLEQSDFFGGEWEEFIGRLNELQENVDLQTFLYKEFHHDRYERLKERVVAFVEGYDAADIRRVSALALKEEWSQNDDEHQYHVEGGYAKLVAFLSNALQACNGRILLSAPVSEIEWKEGHVKVTTGPGDVLYAEKVIITIPLGVLQRKLIRFFPAIATYHNAFDSMGFGGVIKCFVEFKTAFWEGIRGRAFRSASFIFSDAGIPTWWTQLPDETPLLTGWLGGPSTFEVAGSTDEVFERVLTSLQYIFGYPRGEILRQVRHWSVANWTHDSFTLGAYAYPTTETRSAIGLIATPLRDTLFFAGEAVYQGPAIGTVEAALQSGRDVASQVLRTSNENHS